MRPVNFAILGCGEFFRAMHLPILSVHPRANIVATMDVNEDAAKSAAELAGAEYATTDLERVLGDPQIDAVMITTRHDLHAPLTIAAARAGKHVLCEKPMALSVDECRQIAAAVREHRVKYTIGYNRGMAPMISEARRLLEPLPQKKMIYHRIQAAFPEQSWVHDAAIGGGRFVAEGCHIFDLMAVLVGARVEAVYAAGSTFLDPSLVHVPDSALVTLEFADGSVGTTLIASAGCPSFPKEATEIYCAGRAIYIENFQHFETHGFDEAESLPDLSSPDKGHTVEIDRFIDAIIHDRPSPNGLEQAFRAALISFAVGESIEQRRRVAFGPEEFEL